LGPLAGGGLASAFGEPTPSLGSLPNIIPERDNAIVTDRVLQRDREDCVPHDWSEHRRPIPADGALVFGWRFLEHVGIIHQMPSDVGLVDRHKLVHIS
jgi:hypothetical protein